MTDNLEELERLLEKATPGSVQRKRNHIYHDVTGSLFATFLSAREDDLEPHEAAADAEVYVALRNAAPSLIATAREVEGLRAEVVALWHDSNSDRPLHEHLGMTVDQYAAWATARAALEGKGG